MMNERHELRSPLHGVLAATELLKDTKLDQYQNSLIETVDACGRTLLDTINQVLDFSKLMSLERKARRRRRRKALSQDSDSSLLTASRLDLYTPTDLSVVAEEVVEGVFLGHTYNQRSTASLDLLGTSLVAPEIPQDRYAVRPDVKVILDIAPTDWIYHAPPGAVRRIIMNLFSNALKYTPSGQVRLSLETEQKAEPPSKRSGDWKRRKARNVNLTVSDTGKGISEEFLRGRLYTPFAQEDSLAVGSGLGLTIVRSLVQSLGGSIDIQSCLGEGTTVKVTLPLTPLERDELEYDAVLPSAQDREASSKRNHLLYGHEGKTVAILDVEPSDAASHRNWADLARYITEWYGLRLVSPSGSEPIDLILADELPCQTVLRECSATMNTALLVVSDQHVGRASVQAPLLGAIKSVNVTNRPCGPHKLRRYISKCLDEASSLPPESNAVILPERPAPFPISSFVQNFDPLGQMLADEDALPMKSPPFTIPTELAPKAPPESGTKKLGARILIVEDNKVNLNLMLAYLKTKPLAALDSAENGSLAVEAVKKQDNYDIIFMGEFFLSLQSNDRD